MRANSSGVQAVSPALPCSLRGLGRQRLGHHRLARELGVGADQPELGFAAAGAHGGHQAMLQCGQ
jgi:hypothetical protein